jgi:indole-3-glycerol phosphate synthase
MQDKLSILNDILDKKREHVARRKSLVSVQQLIDSASYYEPRRGFEQSIRNSAAPIALIAEIKKASPSRGIICQDFDPVRIAMQYEMGGATCLSVLTDAPYFMGNDKDLQDARESARLPILRKDFIIDEYQLYESKAIGADCILLIAAAFGSHAHLADLYHAAKQIDLDVLVEVHDKQEMETAALLQATMIGINNRNLKTFDTDIATTERLAPLAPSDCVLVSESAITSHADVCRVADAGANAILVGEGLITQSDVPQAVRSLLGI